MHILGSPDRIRSLYVFGTRLLAAAMLVTFALPAHSQGRERSVEHPTVYRTVQIDGLRPLSPCRPRLPRLWPQ